MQEGIGALLVAEIGSLMTRVTLIDTVEGESRFVGRAETMSTLEPPFSNAFIGILEAAHQIAESTGRQLLSERQLIIPQTHEGDGVNHLVAVTSAAGTISLVITAIASDVSARSAIHASRSTYTSILQVITLDDAVTQTPNNNEQTWIERQVGALLGLQPDAVLIAGGLEGGAIDSIARLAHIVALTMPSPKLAGAVGAAQGSANRPVIFAGNSKARSLVVQALADRTEVVFAENIHPSLHEEHLEDASKALQQIYQRIAITRLPGIQILHRLSQSQVGTVCAAESTIVRFLAQRHGRRVLLLDSGATSTTAIYALPTETTSERPFSMAILGSTGSAGGISALLAECGIAAITRWLPFPISESELTNQLLNHMLRPQVLPSNREDLYIEQAVAREALALAVATLKSERPQLFYDVLIGSGGALAYAPQLGMAALILLDALQPEAPVEGLLGSPLALDLQLDTLGLIPVCGALASFNADSAATVFAQDTLRSLPLATCILPSGEGKVGDFALEAEVTTVGGKTQKVSVRHGQIIRIPLHINTSAQLTLRPAPSVRIGHNPPGVAVSSDAGAITGSPLGIIIDARGRPLRLPTDERQRCLLLWEWLVALGAEEGANPYIDQAVAAVQPTIELSSSSPAATIVLNGHSDNAAPPTPATKTPPRSLRQRLGFGKKPTPVAPSASAPSTPPPSAPAPAAAPSEPPTKPGQRITFADLEAKPTPSALDTNSPKPGRRISLDELAKQTPPPTQEKAVDDLSKLRATFQEPKKRGWFNFGRKKK